MDLKVVPYRELKLDRNYSRLSLIGTRIREISVKEYKVNSPSLYKCMQVTPVNTNIFRRSPGVPINESLLYLYMDYGYR